MAKYWKSDIVVWSHCMWSPDEEKAGIKQIKNFNIAALWKDICLGHFADYLIITYILA